MSLYDLSGNEISNEILDINLHRMNHAFDIFGNQLNIGTAPISVPDSSQGTNAGYMFTAGRSGFNYIAKLVIDFIQDSPSFQCFVRNPDTNLYYKFDATRTVEEYNSSMTKIRNIALPEDAGHNNDGCYYNGCIYMPVAPDGHASYIYCWDISNNTITKPTVTGISDTPGNPHPRHIDGITLSPTDGHFFLVCADIDESDNYSHALDHNSLDRLAIYDYDLSTGRATLLGEYPWDVVFVQGAIYYNGLLYVACNTMTTVRPDNYRGITLKVIRTDTWELWDELLLSGTVEPEGMDVMPINGGNELSIGIAHWGEVSMVARFTPPYTLTR